ncbi:MAG: peptidylprolyl isomerase [Crocinitomicaceae bacterium]
MKKIIFLLFSLFFLMISCGEEIKSEEELENKKTAKEKKIEPVVKVNKDFITQANVEEKLSQFGKKNPETQVIIHTDYGDMHVKLYEETPLHRANFIMLNKLHFYDSTVFYRVIKNFMIQGGSASAGEEDELGRPTDQKTWSIGNYRIPPELNKKLIHKRGAIAMANDADLFTSKGLEPDYTSDPFQFYIVHTRQGAKHLDNRYTVFGEVTSGFEVLDKIATAPVEEFGDHYPIEPVKMWVTIVSSK